MIRSFPSSIIITSLFFLLMSLPLVAQQQGGPIIRREKLLFFRYSLTVPINDRWQVEQEVEERTFVAPWRQGEFRLRSHLIRSLGKGWEADAGFMFVWEREPIEPYRDDTSLRLEFRPHQQLAYEHRLSPRFSLQHAYKVEERFFEQINDQGEYKNTKLQFERMRFKYELELNMKVNDWFGLKAFDELVLHTGPRIGPNPFDRNEAGLGFVFTFSDSWAFDATYNYRYNPEGLGEEVVHQHIGRFTLAHALQTKKLE